MYGELSAAERGRQRGKLLNSKESKSRKQIKEEAKCCRESAPVRPVCNRRQDMEIEPVRDANVYLFMNRNMLNRKEDRALIPSEKYRSMIEKRIFQGP